MGPANCRLVDRGDRFPWHSGSRSRTGSPGSSFWPASVFASRRDSHTDQLADEIDHAPAAQTDQQAAIFWVDFDVSEARPNFGGHLAQGSHPTRARALSLMALGGACA